MRFRLHKWHYLEVLKLIIRQVDDAAEMPFFLKLFESMDKAEDVRLIELLEVVAHEHQPQAICPEVEVSH